MESSAGDPVTVAGPPSSTPTPPDGKPAAVSVVKSISDIAQRLNGQSPVHEVDKPAAPAGDVMEVGSNGNDETPDKSAVEGGGTAETTVAATVTNNQAVVSEPATAVVNDQVAVETTVAVPAVAIDQVAVETTVVAPAVVNEQVAVETAVVVSAVVNDQVDVETTVAATVMNSQAIVSEPVPAVVSEPVPVVMNDEVAVETTVAATVMNNQAMVSEPAPAIVSDQVVRTEEVMVEESVVVEDVVVEEPVVMAEPVLVSVPETTTEPVTAMETEIRTESVPHVSSEGNSDSSAKHLTTPPSPTEKQVVAKISCNPVPKGIEAIAFNLNPEVTSSPIPSSETIPVNESVVSTADALQPQVISTTHDSPLSDQGIAANDEEEIEVTQIINKPMSAMMASGSSRKNRRKASRPLQINRERTNDEMESPNQESGGSGSDLNIESMIHAATDITDFCDIANRFMGGDDSQDEIATTPPASSTPAQNPEDDNHQVPVQEMAQVAIARQQNIPSHSSVPILRQSLLPVRHRTSSPTIKQQRASPSNQLRQSSPAPRNLPKIIYKPAQQIIRHLPQQQQVMQQQQPQQFIMQQPVQGMIQSNMIQGGMIQQQQGMIVQQPQQGMVIQQPQQQQGMVFQQGMQQATMVAQPQMIGQQMQQFVQQAAPQQMMASNIMTQQPQQQQQFIQPQQATTMMVQKPAGNVTPPAATGNVQTGKPGQTILVLQRGDTLKLDASGNLVVVGKGDPPPGATPAAPTPPPVPVSKPMNVMQHTAVQNIVQIHNQITGASNIQPAPVVNTVRAPVVNVPTQDQQFVVQQQQVHPTKLLQQLNAQPRIATTNQIAVQGQLLARGQTESKTGTGNIYFTPSTQAPFQMVASKAGKVMIPKTPPALISKPATQIVNTSPASSKIKLIASAVAEKSPIRIIDDSNLVKNSSGDVTLLQCDKCKRLFVSKESLLKHLTEMHSETTQDTNNESKRYQCSACNETFVYQSSLTLHETKMCGKQPWTTAGQSSPFNVVCGICSIRFKFKQELEVHMEMVHKGQQAPVVTTPITISTWGTMPRDKPASVYKNKPPLITTIKMEPGMLPTVQATTVTMITTPSPKRVGRPKKKDLPPPPGTPVNSAGTALAPIGASTPGRGRGRPPKSPGSGKKSPGRFAKRGQKRRISKSSSSFGPPPEDADCGDEDNDDDAYVVKDEKATTRYLCTMHGKYDTSDPRPHRCTLCPKGFLSQHCLLEHIKTHIKPFWCSKCGWKSSRKDNVMRHIELHHKGPKYQQKRKSPTTGRYDPASKRAKVEGMGGIVEGDSDLIDYQAPEDEDETMDTEDKNEEEDGDDSGGSDEEGDEEEGKADDEAEAAKTEIEGTDGSSEKTDSVLNKEGPDEPDKAGQVASKEDAIKNGDGKTDTPSEESLVSSTTNHFLGYNSHSSSKPQTSPETSAITQPDINTGACLGGKITNNQGLTTTNISNSSDANEVHTNLSEDVRNTNHDNSTNMETDALVAKTTEIEGDQSGKEVIDGNPEDGKTVVISNDSKKDAPTAQNVDSAIITNTQEKTVSDQDVEIMETDAIDMDVISEQQIDASNDVTVISADKSGSTVSAEVSTTADDADIQVVSTVKATGNNGDQIQIQTYTSSEIGRPKSPPYADLSEAGNVDKGIASLIDELISSIEEEDDDGEDEYEEMDAESISSDEVVEDDDGMSGCQEIEELSNQDSNFSRVADTMEEETVENPSSGDQEEVAIVEGDVASLTVEDQGRSKVIDGIANTAHASTTTSEMDNTTSKIDNTISVVDNTVSEMDNTPVVFQMAPDQEGSDESQDETPVENDAPETVSQTSDVAPDKAQESSKLVDILKTLNVKVVTNNTRGEPEEVMIIEDNGEKQKVADIIDIDSEDEQHDPQKIAKLPNMSKDLPAPPPLISTAQSSILGRKTLTKQSSGILEKVLQRLDPKEEPTDGETKSAEEMSLLQLEQDATQVIQNAEKALLEQRVNNAQVEQLSSSPDLNPKPQEEQLPVIASVTSLSTSQEKSHVPSSLGHSIANMMGHSEPRMMRPPGHQMMPGQGHPYQMMHPQRFDPRYMQQQDGSYTIQWRGNEANGNDPRRPPVMQPNMIPPGMHPMYNTDQRYLTPQQVNMMRQGFNPSMPPHIQQQHMQQHPAFVRTPNQMPTYVNQPQRMPQQFPSMPGTMGNEHQSIPSSPTIIQGVQYPTGSIPGRENTPPTPTSINQMEVVPGARMFGEETVIHVQANGTPIIVPQGNKTFFNPNEIQPNIPTSMAIAGNGTSQLKKMLSSGVPDTNANYSSMVAATAAAGPVNNSFQPATQMNGEIHQDKILVPGFSPTTPGSSEQNVPPPHRRHSSGSSRKERRREKATSPENRRKSVNVTSIQSTDPDFDITERPYICHICGKGFKRRNNLTDHVRIHSRPYKCGECNFGTTRWQYLAEHMRKTHGFEADDKEFEKLFKDSGKKLKPTDYIPESSLMPIIAQGQSSESDELPSQLGVSSWTNAGEFNRKESLTVNDSDLVDLYGQQQETTFVSPTPPKQSKKTNMRRAAVAAEDLINKVTQEDKEDEQVLIKPVTLPKAKLATTESEWQAFIKETGSETSERTDITETEDSQSIASNLPPIDTDTSSIAPSSIDEPMTIKQEQMWEDEAMDTEETSYADESENKENVEDYAGHEEALLDGGVAMSCEAEAPEESNEAELESNTAENTMMDEEMYGNIAEEEDEDSVNNNEQEQEISFSKCGRPRRRSATFQQIAPDVRDLYDDDYRPSGPKKKKALVMKINLKELSIRGGGRGRGRGRPRGSGHRGRGGGGRGRAASGGRGASNGRGVSSGRGIRREENRVSLPPEGDVPIKTNEQGGIDLHHYFIEVEDAERPFQCQVNDCRKQFKSKQHMREHLFTHLRPYKCDVCGMGFARTDYLAMHMKDDHNVKATKEQLFEKRKLANARAMVCRSRPSKDHKRQELYEMMHSP